MRAQLDSKSRRSVRFTLEAVAGAPPHADDERRHSQESLDQTLPMPSLLARLQGDLNAARKSQDKPRVLLLGTIIADVKNREIEVARELTDADVTEVIRRGIKRRRESIEMYDAGGRADLAAIERVEVDALAAYVPAGASTDEIRAAVIAAIDGGATNVGDVMGKVMAQFKGRAEGGTINGIVREELGKRA
jgi:hypothetical protein